MISHKHKFIFIFPPKTGSTSLSDCLLSYASIRRVIDQKHLNSFDFLEHGEDFNRKRWKQFTRREHIVPRKHATLSSYHEHDVKNYTLCATIRNPYDRMVSFWKWWSPNTNFKNWIKDHQRSWTKRPQLDFLHSDAADVSKIILIRFENLQNDFDEACDKIGIPKQQLTHANKTNHIHYTEYYDDETREIIAERYSQDIEYFGYEFREQDYENTHIQ